MILATVRDSQRQEAGYVEAVEVLDGLEIRFVLEPRYRERWQPTLDPALQAGLSLSMYGIIWVVAIRAGKQQRTDLSELLPVLSQGELFLEYDRQGIEQARLTQIRLWRRADEAFLDMEEPGEFRSLRTVRHRSEREKDAPDLR